MPSFRLNNEADRKAAMAALVETPADGTHQCKIEKTSKRRAAANRLAWLWYTHIGKEQGDTPEEIHRQCKLEYGVAILLRDNDEFAEAWELLRHYSYEDKLKAMRLIDVTSIMTVKQMTEYLDTMETDYGRHGIALPRPEDQYFEAMGYTRREES